jgi:hypothetical protein
MPASVIGEGRSPNRIPATTGIDTPHTAVVGAITDIVPIASARYNRPMATPPARPEIAPQIASRCVGELGGISGITKASTTSPANPETTTTAEMCARRDASPPMKSAAP